MKNSTKWTIGIIAVVAIVASVIFGSTKLQLGRVTDSNKFSKVIVERQTLAYQYKIIVSDEESIGTYEVKNKDGVILFGGKDRCPANKTSDVLTIAHIYFPLTAKVTDCKGKTTKLSNIWKPAFSGDTASVVIIGEGTPSNDTPTYRFQTTDSQGLSYVAIKTSSNNYVYTHDFSSQCQNTNTTDFFPLDANSWSLSASVIDCVGNVTDVQLENPNPPPPMADLIVTGVTFGENEQGTKTFTITAKNQGNAPTTGGNTVAPGRVDWAVQYYHANENNYFAATMGYFKYKSPNNKKFFAAGEENSDTHVMPDADRLEFQVKIASVTDEGNESDLSNNSFTAYPPIDLPEDSIDFEDVEADIDQDLPFNPFQ